MRLDLDWIGFIDQFSESNKTKQNKKKVTKIKSENIIWFKHGPISDHLKCYELQAVLNLD